MDIFCGVILRLIPDMPDMFVILLHGFHMFHVLLGIFRRIYAKFGLVLEGYLEHHSDILNRSSVRLAVAWRLV